MRKIDTGYITTVDGISVVRVNRSNDDLFADIEFELNGEDADQEFFTNYLIEAEVKFDGGVIKEQNFQFENVALNFDGDRIILSNGNRTILHMMTHDGLVESIRDAVREAVDIAENY